MARTIAISEDVYKRLKKLKDLLNVGYSDLISILIETYRKYRLEELKRLCNELKINEKEAEKITKIYKQLRNRKWW